MTEVSQDFNPGAVLGAERDSRGWSVEYISDQINLNKSVVIALEADDYASLPPPAFVRGYIRAYAKLLEIESDSLVVKYEQLEMPVADVVPLVEPQARVTSDPLIRMVSGLVVAVVLGVLAYWWYNNRFAEDPQLATSTEAAEESGMGAESFSNTEQLFKADEPTVARGSTLVPGVSYEKPADLTNDNPNALPLVEVPVSAVLQNNPVIQQLSDETVELNNTPENIQEAVILTHNSEAGAVINTDSAEVERVAVDADVAASEPENTVMTTEVQGTDILLLKTESESWVSVIDAVENRLMYGILTSGTPRKLQGLAPFSVVLGAAPGIEATLNGSNVDFSSLIRKSNTARFVIDQTGDAHR